MSREYIINSVYVSDTGIRSEILAPSIYLNETTTTPSSSSSVKGPDCITLMGVGG